MSWKMAWFCIKLLIFNFGSLFSSITLPFYWNITFYRLCQFLFTEMPPFQVKALFSKPCIYPNYQLILHMEPFISSLIIKLVSLPIPVSPDHRHIAQVTWKFLFFDSTFLLLDVQLGLLLSSYYYHTFSVYLTIAICN